MGPDHPERIREHWAVGGLRLHPRFTGIIIARVEKFPTRKKKLYADDGQYEHILILGRRISSSGSRWTLCFHSGGEIFAKLDAEKFVPFCLDVKAFGFAHGAVAFVVCCAWSCCSLSLFSNRVQANFIRDYLGPVIRRDHPDVKIMAFDHNRDHRECWVGQVGVFKYVEGARRLGGLQLYHVGCRNFFLYNIYVEVLFAELVCAVPCDACPVGDVAVSRRRCFGKSWTRLCRDFKKVHCEYNGHVSHECKRATKEAVFFVGP